MLKRLIATSVDRLVNAFGGIPISLPGGETARVALQCRQMARDYEALVIERFLTALRPEMTFVDVGAHWGLFTLLAASRVSHVIAFEPSRRNRQLLAENVQLSGFLNVQVRPEAISDRAGVTTFHEYPGRTWGMTMMGGLLPQPFTQPVQAPALSLDALDLSPGLVKIDVEGAESLALAGAMNTISRSRPLLFLEVHHRRITAFGSNADELLATLQASAYEVETVWEFQTAGEEKISHWICSPEEGLSRKAANEGLR